MSRWSQYVAVKLRGPQSELAARGKVQPSTLSRWLSGEVPPSASQAINFARNLGDSPIQALVMADYLTPDEAGMNVRGVVLDEISEIVLLDELKRRAILRME